MSERAHTKVRERPIIFSAPMVRALLDGRKTQTRRVLKPQPEMTSTGYWHVRWQVGGGCFVPITAPDGLLQGEILDGLRIARGDRLWVREAWRATGCNGRSDYLPPRDLQPHPVWYEANGAAPAVELVGKIRPSMFMPRWASRLTLTVTGVRVQRLQDISEEDARAEGMDDATAQIVLSPDERHMLAYAHIATPHALSRIIFETVWEQINGLGSWAANPWVAAYTFTVERRNIDASISEVDHG